MATDSAPDSRKLHIQYYTYFCGIATENPSIFEFNVSEFPICELRFGHESGYRNFKKREDDPGLAALDNLFAAAIEENKRIRPVEEFWLKEGHTEEEVHILHSCIQELFTSVHFPQNKETTGCIWDLGGHSKVSKIFDKIITIPSLKDDIKLIKERSVIFLDM